MTHPIDDALRSVVSLDQERLEAESALRLAASVAKASEHIGLNTLGLWLQIAETRETLGRILP